MALETQTYTAADLLHLPDDGWRYELVKGELRRMPPAGHEHGGIAATITMHLGSYVRTHDLGRVYAAETGFLIATRPDTVRAPDVAFVRKERLGAGISKEGYWPGAPDLAVEVISPNDTYTEVAEKVADWLAAGTQQVWVVNPRRRTVVVHSAPHGVVELAEDETLDGGDLLPGWSVSVRDLFA